MKIQVHKPCGHVLIPVLFAFFILADFHCSVQAAEGKNTNQINCDIQNAACTQTLSDCDVTLDIQPRPVKAMTDLTFIVTLSDKVQLVGDPCIDLGMPGMKMGPNHVTLGAKDKNTYEGTGIIVRCPSGRRTWKAAVNIPGKGVAEFIFDVIY